MKRINQGTRAEDRGEDVVVAETGASARARATCSIVPSCVKEQVLIVLPN